MTNQEDEKCRQCENPMLKGIHTCEMGPIYGDATKEIPGPTPSVADLPTDDLPSPDEEHRRLYEERRRQRYGINRC